MSFLNVEIKARCNNPESIRHYLLSNNADFKGADEQTDTYFTVTNGRLKLREGKIENNLIFYERNNQAGPKSSHFNLVKIEDAKGLKEILTKSCGIKVIVKKQREIYYISNVKFHIDEVPALGSFVEIEAGNVFMDLSKEQLQQQCEFYMKEFNIEKEDLIEISYSDMLLKESSTV
jgi:predicted adenylyl cyclase CyaB